MAAVAHLSAISSKYAFMHCFDGFRTSHEMQRIETLDYEELRDLTDWEAVKTFRKHSLLVSMMNYRNFRSLYTRRLHPQTILQKTWPDQLRL